MGISSTQKKILEFIKKAVEAGESPSLRDIGDVLNMAASSILYHIRKLEEKGFLVRNVNGKVVRVNSPNENSAIGLLPLLAKVSCGQPLDAVVDEATIRMVPIPLYLLGKNTKKQLYVIEAVGKSMYPKIEEGDYVVFQSNIPPKNGDIVVARTNEGFTIKVFKDTKSQLILMPKNPEYQPLVFDKNQENEAFNIDGVAIGIFRPQENLEGGDNKNGKS